SLLLSLISNLKIYIREDIMRRQSVPYNENAKGVSLPVNTISDEMLQAALDKAIQDEDYELASHLRDEKKRRKKSVD
ncbi:MAG: UvrB/UvrC motif-containing protein, partial [Prevotella sp.]|nr:UvrB/UvrC motif-containing protein [Prevotella sp.]